MQSASVTWDSSLRTALQQQQTLIRSAIAFLLCQSSKIQTYLTYWESFTQDVFILYFIKIPHEEVRFVSQALIDHIP